MGLFSKHKKTEDAPIPPTIGSGNAIPEPSSNMADLNANLPAPQVPELNSNLAPPPIPGGSLDDIKNQVSNNSNNETESNSKSEVNENLSENNTDLSTTDSLFNMLDEDLSNENSKTNTKNNEAFNLDILDNDSTVETNMSRDDSLSFMGNRNYGHNNTKDNCFLTTAQFKSLLEIVEQVKSKVKNSTDIHLRLIDIKSEEDIEYENLRRNFQQIEDKLYELDNILFEK